MRNFLLILYSIIITTPIFCQTETFGSPSGTISIGGYMGYANPTVSYSGSGDIRSTSVSNYSGASGGGNAFLTNNGSSSLSLSNIQLVNSSTSGTLCFGVFKSTTASNGSELSISALQVLRFLLDLEQLFGDMNASI